VEKIISGNYRGPPDWPNRTGYEDRFLKEADLEENLAKGKNVAAENNKVDS